MTVGKELGAVGTSMGYRPHQVPANTRFEDRVGDAGGILLDPVIVINVP
jgi:hypothetical protein